MALRVRNTLNMNSENDVSNLKVNQKRAIPSNDGVGTDPKRVKLCVPGNVGLQEVTNRNTRSRVARATKERPCKSKENAEPIRKKISPQLPSASAQQTKTKSPVKGYIPLSEDVIRANNAKARKLLPNLMKPYDQIEPSDYYFGKPDLPEGVEDMDFKVINNCNCEPQYAHDNFMYHRERETMFLSQPYTDRQKEVTPIYRSLLVDWMVEVQESFELNHETLYLAVKIVDHYLAKSEEIIARANLQLLGCTAILIACKLDERIPPSLDDFVYICDDAYKKDEIKAMEVKVLTCLNFDLNMPLSYSFLRRFARSIDLTMRELTLARYILETSLLDYDLLGTPDSLIAAGSLLLALDMLGKDWNETLVYYTGYEQKRLISIRSHLAKLVEKTKNNRQTRTIYSKYSHEVFHEVASIHLPAHLLD